MKEPLFYLYRQRHFQQHHKLCDQTPQIKWLEFQSECLYFNANVRIILFQNKLAFFKILIPFSNSTEIYSNWNIIYGLPISKWILKYLFALNNFISILHFLLLAFKKMRAFKCLIWYTSKCYTHLIFSWVKCTLGFHSSEVIQKCLFKQRKKPSLV